MSEVADKLHRPQTSVRVKARQLGVTFQPSPNAWTLEKENLLITHWDSSSIDDLVKMLGMAKTSIYAKGRQLKLQTHKNKVKSFTVLSDLPADQNIRYCACGNVVDRPGRATKCLACIRPRYNEPKQIRQCKECCKPYRGRTRIYCSAFCRNTANNKAKIARAGSAVVTEKLCRVCEEVKPAWMFNYDSSKKDGLSSSGCRECQAKKHAIWRESNKDSIRSSNLKRTFGISIEEYDKLLDYQGGVCAMCKQPCKSGKRLAVDHDHNTGAIRSLLCMKCNKHKVGDLTLEDALAIVKYLQNPMADKVFGVTRYVPSGMEKPKKRRRKRVK